MLALHKVGACNRRPQHRCPQKVSARNGCLRPLFESGSVTYKKSSIVSPVDLPIRCDLRHNDDAKDPLGAYRLEFKVSVPTTEFENQQTLTGPKTDRAHFFKLLSGFWSTWHIKQSLGRKLKGNGQAS